MLYHYYPTSYPGHFSFTVEMAKMALASNNKVAIPSFQVQFYRIYFCSFKSFRVGVLPCLLEEIVWSDSIHLVDSDQPRAVKQGLSLEQYAQLRCIVVLPGTAARRICSFLITSSIACGIRIITLEETTRIVCVGLSRPLLVQPAVVNDITAKVNDR